MSLIHSIPIIVSLIPVAGVLLLGLLCCLFAFGLLRELPVRKVPRMTQADVERTLELEELRKRVA